MEVERESPQVMERSPTVKAEPQDDTLAVKSSAFEGQNSAVLSILEKQRRVNENHQLEREQQLNDAQLQPAQAVDNHQQREQNILKAQKVLMTEDDEEDEATTKSPESHCPSQRTSRVRGESNELHENENEGAPADDYLTECEEVYAWMNDEPEEMVDVGQIKCQLARYQGHGNLTAGEKIKQQQLLRQYRFLTDSQREFSPEESLFVEERRESTPIPVTNTMGLEDTRLLLAGSALTRINENEETQSNASEMPHNKQKRKYVKNTRKSIEQARNNDRRKSQKTGQGSKQHRPSGNSSSCRDEGVIEEDNLIKGMLSNINANPVEEYMQNPGRVHGAGPQIIGNRNGWTRSTQLQQLIASAPEGVDRKTIRSQKKQLQEAARAFGGKKIRAVDGRWLLKGMKHPLYHHQLLAAAWMVGRETGGVKPYGGLLADSMGLGKTIEMLACMVGNPFDESRHQPCKATLIVLPSAVIDQWEKEIQEHAGETFKKVVRYRKAADYRRFQLEPMDIVLVSYTEVMKQFAYPSEAEKGLMKKMGYNAWFAASDTEQGILHEIDWYRIVLDEAHLIKNIESRTSTACLKLRSVFRWCLSGTPLQNKVDEMYPYLKFLKANYTMNLPTFQKNLCNVHNPECRDRIRTILSICMMRRTMGDTMLGRPIVNLPKPVSRLRKIDFSKEEFIIYRITEDRFRDIMNTFLAKGDKRRTYSMFMVQLLRLRQCTSHPYMLERVIKECWTAEDVAKAREKLTALGTIASEKFCARTKLWVEDAQAQVEGNNTLGGFGRGLMGHSFSMEQAFETLDIFCVMCSDMATEPLRSSCGHVFCTSCFDDLGLTQLGRDHRESEMVSCPLCKSIIHSVKRVESYHDEDDVGDDEIEHSEEVPAANSKSKGKKGKVRFKKRKIPRNSKGLDFNGYEPFTPHSTWITASDESPEFPITSSAKITALKAELLNAFEKDPLEKVVIFVQFKLLARIIGRLCNEEGWPFLYFTGDIGLDQRAHSIEIFKSNSSVRILLSGLKCGGVGLNLTCASRCISMDLWWNHSIEQQAFSRIFRIGQKKHAIFTRIVVNESVEDRMLSLQAHKLREIETVMNSHDTSEKLSLNNLEFLFGFLNKPKDKGIGDIETDYDSDE